VSKESVPVCQGPNYHPEKGPAYSAVKEAGEVIRAHLHSEWISEGCAADHAFGCPSCQAVFLERELEGLVSWLGEEQDVFLAHEGEQG